MKSLVPVFLAALSPLVLPLPAMAQHFTAAYIDIRLVKPDSILVEVSADRQDLMNTVGTFPALEKDVYDNAYRVYQQRIEAYLQGRVPVRVDGKTLSLSAVSWKPGGRDRDDWLDSVSIWESYHVITLGARLPRDAKSLTVRADLWMEREDKAPITTVEYGLFEGKRALRRLWTRTERPVRFPLHPDSLAAMRKTTPPPGFPRVPVDHTGHEH